MQDDIHFADLLKLWECSEDESEGGDKNHSKRNPGEDLRIGKSYLQFSSAQFCPLQQKWLKVYRSGIKANEKLNIHHEDLADTITSFLSSV